ncbi:hypothetical protein EPN42_15405, partial [bacterium]
MQGAQWIHNPVGRQNGGGWVDDALGDRPREIDPVGKRLVSGSSTPQRVEMIRSADVDATVNELFYRRGWTDGVPIVPPTPARVREMVRFSPSSAATVLGELDPMHGEASVEILAVNAVMAGCRPEYFPVVLAAVRGMLDPKFNLRGVQTTDENVTPLVIVSGPLAEELGINADIGALGPGWRANATIGRALRLIMNNVGGGWPGVMSLAGIGQPARYTLCLAERTHGNPWAPLHVEAGLPAEASAVTLLRAECSVNVTGDLDDVANVMASAASAFGILHGGCVAVLIAPATATRLAGMGWRKLDVSRYLFERARMPVEQWKRLWVRTKIAPTYGLPPWVSAAEAAGAPIPVVERAED